MIKKFILILGFVLIGSYFLNIQLKDDRKEIERMIQSINEPLIKIAHVELLDKTHAIAFYESFQNGVINFGSAKFRKGLFGWKSLGFSSGQISQDHLLDWGFSNLEQDDFGDYTDLIRGKILEPEIDRVQIITKAGNKYEANIIEYNSGERLWFYISKGEDLIGATIKGLSKDGKVIEEL